MEDALCLLLDRAATEDRDTVGDDAPPTLTIGAMFRMMLVCRRWRDLVIAQESSWWRAIASKHLGLAKRAIVSPTEMARHMHANTRCRECGRVRRGRACVAADDWCFGRPLLVCLACQGDAAGFRSMIDRKTARLLVRHHSNGFRRKGRNIERMFHELLIARWTRSAGVSTKTLYWRYQIVRRYP